MAPTPTGSEVAEKLMRGPLMGTMFAMLLYGIISLQCQLYYHQYPKDPIFIKCVVAVIWILETIQVVLAIYFIDKYLIDNFGSIESLLVMEWSLGVTAIFGFVIGLTVNLFFVWRIWLLSKSVPVTVSIGLLATVRAGLGITATSFGKPFPDWKDFLHHADPFILSGLALGVVVDCLITLSVSRQLLRGRSGAKSTNALVNRLLGYTLNTGLITSVFAITEIITYKVYPTTLIFLAFVFVQSKLYANCLLATLNARNNLRERLPSVNISTGSGSVNVFSRVSKWTSRHTITRPPEFDVSTGTVVPSELSSPMKSPIHHAISLNTTGLPQDSADEKIHQESPATDLRDDKWSRST